jgi:hypothetical protein
VPITLSIVHKRRHSPQRILHCVWSNRGQAQGFVRSMGSPVFPNRSISQLCNPTMMELPTPEVSSAPSSAEDVLPAIEMQNQVDRRPVMLYARQFAGQSVSCRREADDVRVSAITTSLAIMLNCCFLGAFVGE